MTALYSVLCIYKVLNAHNNPTGRCNPCLPVTEEEAEEQSNLPTITSLASGRVHSIIQQKQNNVLFLGGFKNLQLSFRAEIDQLAVFGL